MMGEQWQELESAMRKLNTEYDRLAKECKKAKTEAAKVNFAISLDQSAGNENPARKPIVDNCPVFENLISALT